MSKKDNLKRSMFGEFSLLSGGMLAGVIALCVLSIALYIYLSLPISKKVVVDDKADIFSSSELDDIEAAAKKLSKAKDINVVLITTRDKNHDLKSSYKYSDSDEDCNKFAHDYYYDKAAPHKLRDNSGICILVDLSIDEPGMRYFRLFTNGTAYYAVSNEDCDRIFRNYRGELAECEYYTAISGVLKDLGKYSFTSYGFVTFFCLIGPALLALLICFAGLRKGKLDKAPQYKEYLSESEGVQANENFLRQKVVVTYDSDSSSGGGGFSGGGGGGGGGHSGGGGGRF
ncbi:Uncharacterized membrane protein YgcG, contains a TPM-fold domain [Ruminococcaceae bacterium YRB3002]|nr:Uncharacterized membrane protein YgcG, contains a TPM-fold domain [Ruminococcaceae bacterium YRB3002]